MTSNSVKVSLTPRVPAPALLPSHRQSYLDTITVEKMPSTPLSQQSGASVSFLQDSQQPDLITSQEKSQRIGDALETPLSSLSPVSAIPPVSQPNHLHGAQDKEESMLSDVRKNVYLSFNSDSPLESLPFLQQRLGLLWERKMLTDVRILVGATNDVLLAHKLLLATGSPVFRNLFYPPQSEPSTHANYDQGEAFEQVKMDADGYISIAEPDYPTESFEVFLKAFYTNEIPISVTLPMALDLFRLSKKYQARFLQDQVIEHIHQSVTIANVFEAFNLCTSTIELSSLVYDCWKIIELYTEEVLEFHLESIDRRTWIRILEREPLSIDEIKLFQYVVRWAGIQCRRKKIAPTAVNRRQVLEPMIRHIRFCGMCQGDLDEVLRPSRLFTLSEIQIIENMIAKPHLKAAPGYSSLGIRRKHLKLGQSSSVPIIQESDSVIKLPGTASDSILVTSKRPIIKKGKKYGAPQKHRSKKPVSGSSLL